MSYPKILIVFFILGISYLTFLPVANTQISKTIKVVVLDTGLDLTDQRFKSHLCSEGHKDFTGTGLVDHHSHGTHIAGIIVENTGNVNYCLIIVKYLDMDHQSDINQYLNALSYSVSLNPDIINMSLYGNDYSENEKQLILNSPDIRFVVASGNDSLNLNEYNAYPATYHLKNEIVVGSLDWLDHVSKFSNYGFIVDKWQHGENVNSMLPNGQWGTYSGTSQATALETAELLRGTK